MEIVLQIPDDIGEKLKAQRTDLARWATGALAAEACRVGSLTSTEVQGMLGLPSRLETDGLLKQARVYLDYSEDDLRRDIETLRALSGSGKD